MDEGYIKFKADWRKMPPPSDDDLGDLLFWRAELHRQHLIGVYENGIGYGNISRRVGKDGRFVISGSATGHLPVLAAEHFTRVVDVDVDENTVCCEGPVIASSESMSHAAIYLSCPIANGVIHVHHAAMWEQLFGKVPTTDQAIPYGSPEMARAIMGLFEKTDVASQQIFVMGGHPEGIMVFGQNLAEAVQILNAWLKKP